jgi:hypothetical protein
MPHCANDTAVGARGWNDGFNVGCINRRRADATAGRLLAQAQRGVCGNLCATEHGLQWESDGQLKTGAEERAEIPCVWVEKGVDGKV